MATLKQIEANRRNALKSTGPRTPEGKAVVAANPIRHGLRASDVVLYDEDRNEFDALRAALAAEHQPSGPAEDFLVEAMAVAAWKLRRVHRAEAGYFMNRAERKSYAHVARGFRRDKIEVAKASLASVVAFDQPFLEFTGRLQVRLERSWFRALHELERRRAAREGHPVPPPLAVELHSDAA